MEYALYMTRKKIDALKVNNRYEYQNIVDRLMINIFNKDAQAYKKAKSECVEKQIDPSKIDDIQSMMSEISSISEYKYDKLPDKTTLERYTFLKSRYPSLKKEDLIKCVLRYSALGMGGQQWRLYPKILEKINAKGINIEGFASPFNNYFTKFYSIFKDDKIFGSLGSFLKAEHPADEYLYVNPPFTPFILSCLPNLLKKVTKCVIITPTWEDAQWYKELEAEGFTRVKKFGTKYCILNCEFIPKFTTTMWFKGLTPEDI